MSSEFTQEQREQVDGLICTHIARVLKIMKEHFGEEAYQVFVKTQGEEKRSNFSKLAEEGGDNSIEALIKIVWGASPEEMKVFGFEYSIEETESGFQINCTKCPWHDMAKRNNITEQMFYYWCEADPFMVEGFNPNIGFKRTKTLMRGDNCCDHFYYYKGKSE